MVLKRHRMSDKFQAFIQTAVRLDVEIFSILVRNIKQLLRIAVYRAAVIDFKLNAEMAKAFAVKYKIRCVIVLVNNVTMLIPAGCAVGVVVIIPIRAVTMNNAVAVFAADVVFIKAAVAECVGIVLDGVFLVDPLGAVVADYGQAVGAILSEPVIFRLEHFVDWVFCTAVCTNSCFAHCLFLHFV